MLVLFVIFVVCYLVPTIVALLRRHADKLAIIALNVLLGWSVIGWISALIWSLSDPRGRGGGQTVVVNTTQNLVTPYPTLQPVNIEPTRPAPQAPLLSRAEPHPQLPPMVGAADADTAFWDGMPSKNDPDSLEEYLVRFPNGRFAGLAQSRLRRATGAPRFAPQPEVVLPAEAPQAEPAVRTLAAACPACGEDWEADAQFCVGCGQRRVSIS